MGSSNFRCHNLQWLSLRILGRLSTVVAIAAISTGFACAEVFPTRGTLEYIEPSSQTSSLKIEGTDGKIYELTLRPEQNGNEVAVQFVDIVLLPQGSGPDARNLLEPKVWHGYPDFMLGGWDYVKGPAKSIYGPTRNFILKKQRMMVKATVSRVAVRPIKTALPNSHAFNRLVVDVEVSNLK